MAAFSQIAATRSRKPAAIVVLGPKHFSPAWQDLPEADVAVGIRLLSEDDVQQVKAAAAKNARAYYPEVEDDDELLNDCFKDELIKLCVARAACNANDAADPYFVAPDEMVGEAFLPSTIRRLWDELERCTIATSPVLPPADADAVEALRRLLKANVQDKLTDAARLRALKLVRFLADELGAAEEALR